MSGGTAEAVVDRHRSVADRDRCLRVVWQDQTTRAFHEVATLTVPADGEGEYVFRYRHPLPESFVAFAAVPDTSRDYGSPRLFPFFANRIMSARRADYDEYLAALGLTRDEATPFEMFARTGGGRRATDTVQVIPDPVVQDDGAVEQLFLASGVRYQDDADELLAALNPGDELVLRDESDNPHDVRAILLDARRSRPVGYVPSYLLDEVHDARGAGADVRVRVEQANGPDVPAHLRLLCRMRTTPAVGA